MTGSSSEVCCQAVKMFAPENNLLQVKQVMPRAREALSVLQHPQRYEYAGLESNVTISAEYIMLHRFQLFGTVSPSWPCGRMLSIMLQPWRIAGMDEKTDETSLKSPALTQMIIEKAPAGIIIVNAAGWITDFNPAASIMSGYRREEALGRPVLEVLPCQTDREDCPIRAVLRGEEVQSHELLILNCLGQTVPVMFSAFPLKNEEDKLLGGVIICRDLSPIKHLEKERRQLVQMFAHDLKIPVMGAGGLLMRLLKGKAGPLTEPQVAYLQTIIRDMSNLEELINNFQELISLDLHILTPLASTLQVEEECREVIRLLSPLAEAKSISLEGEYPQEVLVLRTDHLLFRRVLENLLGNAIKYSLPHTVVTLKVNGEGDEVLFAVQDQGPGILPKDLPHLFKIYYRGAEAGKERGFGLGLATVKRIIEVLGGALWVESQPGQGTIFYFTLPRGSIINDP